MAEQDYRPGDTVPRSGIYLAVHADHRGDHEAVVLQGAQFPACKHCRDGVRFRLLRSATPIEDDRDFSGSESGSRP
jgi:hypothetical protein